ncbi:MAG: PucC family protein [Burkholderiaceae bacterium]
MASWGRELARAWGRLGPRFLPFADVATPDLPLSRLLRLSLFQVSVGMALVLLVGTLNRVMIVELGVPTSLVALMVALPIVFAPMRALIGFQSDHFRSELGWRRVPFIWKGSLYQFGGFAVMPFALLVLAGQGQAASAPIWIGLVAAALAFLLVGAGLHMVQTVGLALATDLTSEASRPRVVGLMYVTLLLGMLVSALAFGHLLEQYSHGRLIQVIQGAAVLTLLLNVLAIWKQEPRQSKRSTVPPADEPSFSEAWQVFSRQPGARRWLVIIGLGTMAFTMEDVLLEPYGGEMLGLSVSATTLLTATLALGSLIGFGLAAQLLSRGGHAGRLAAIGLVLGIPAFFLVILAAPFASGVWFSTGVFMIGLGAGLFSHGTLTTMMGEAVAGQSGLALGAWGAVQATAAGFGMAVGGVLKDLLTQFVPAGYAYSSVYGLEILLLFAALAVAVPLLRFRKSMIA